jgi:GNAT superfamily N-acetyltransferase
VDMDLISQLEEISCNAWVPLQSMIYDGWVIRMANGYTKRANSIHPLYISEKPLLEKVAFCEELYARHHLPTIFKLTPASQPPELDDFLVERGYEYEPEVSVQTVSLKDFKASDFTDMHIFNQPSSQWLRAFQKMQNLSPLYSETLEKILANILPAKAFASIERDDKVIACGLGVFQSGYVGLYDIATDERFRRRGYGMQIVKSLMMWGKKQGASQCYLQVMIDNNPALQLYEKLGFIERYRYWYRIKTLPKT